MNRQIENIVKDSIVEFKDKFTIGEYEDFIIELETLENEIDKPDSTNKRLELTSLHFDGCKNNGDIIDFNINFSSGANMIIADNLKGKSSVFKIIKLALTGNDSIKEDVRPWIKNIILKFKINMNNYVIILDLTAPRVNGRLISGDICRENSFDVFSEKSLSAYAEKIQDFFFKEYSYFSMRWTQHSSSKENAELLDVGTSWKTYYKSIYLESKDSTDLAFGAQNKKIFLMLLGLQYTSFINKLIVKKELLMPELNKVTKSDNIDFLNELILQRSVLQTKMEEFQNKDKLDISKLHDEFDNTNDMLLKELQLTKQKNDYVNTLNQKQRILQEQINISSEDLRKTKKSIIKYKNQKIDLEEYIGAC